MTTTETAVTRRPDSRIDITKPIGNAITLKDMLGGASGAMAALLPKHLTPERMIRMALIAVNRQPELLNCTGESILESIMRAAELGLDCSGTLGEAYLVPFNNKVKGPDGSETWRKSATLIPGYRGLAKLARQSGEVKRIEAEVVYDKDSFIYQKGTAVKVEFRPVLRPGRGAPIGAYALIEFKDGGIQADFMTTVDIEKIRSISKQSNGMAWSNHWPEMAKKTVWRRLAKWVELSSEKYRQALAMADNEFDFNGPDVLDVRSEPQADGRSHTDALAERLGATAAPAPASKGKRKRTATATTKPKVDTPPDRGMEDEAAIIDGAPMPWEQCVVMLADKAGCKNDAAEARLAPYVRRLYGGAELQDLDESQINDLTDKIASGAVKMSGDGKDR